MTQAAPAQHNVQSGAMHEEDASIVATRRTAKVNAYVVTAVLALVTGLAGWIASSTQKSPVQGPEPRLTAAPRKPVPELKPEFKTEPRPVYPAIPVPTDLPAAPASPGDPLKMLQQQLDLQRTEKARSLREARLKSALDPSDGGDGAGAGAALLPELQLPQVRPAAAQALSAPAASDKNTAFALGASGQGVPSSQAAAIGDPEHKILQGKIIEAVILPRIVSDLPGMVCALTQRDVYAERGRRVLIPWGSRLCGVYNAELRKGQNRLFTIWNTLRVANADGTLSEVALDSAGSDQLGSAGTGGLVDTHFAEIFGTSALLSIIGAGAANMAVSPDYQNYSAAQYRTSVQQAAAQTAQSVLAPYVNMPPTVTVPAGTRIRIFVNRDLDFSGLLQSENPAGKVADSADFFD
jgi:type IV secretion system protein VirB10